MSSFVIASPDVFASASEDLSAIGSVIRAAHVAAAPSTTTVAAAAEDEVSQAIASLFSGYAQRYQALSAQASAFHDTFVNLLGGGAAQYVSTEIANAGQMLVNTVQAPSQSLLGNPAASSPSPGVFSSLIDAALINPTVISTAKSVIDAVTTTTSSTKSYGYGTDGTQTVTVDRVVLNLAPLADEVQNVVQGSLGSQLASSINGLSGTPLLTSTTISGSDSAGKSVTTVDYRTLGGFGIGVNADTANQSYSANLSIPGFDISSGASPAGFYGSSHVLGSGGALAVNNGSVIASVQFGAELSKDLSLGDASATIQVNTATGNVSGDLSLNSGYFGAFKGDLLLDPGDGIGGTYTQSGWLNSLLVGTSDPVNIPLQLDNPSFLGSYPPALNPSKVLDDLTSGVNFSSLNKLTIQSQVGNNPITQGIDGFVGDLSNWPTQLLDFGYATDPALTNYIVGVCNAPADLLLGHPLIGDGGLLVNTATGGTGSGTDTGGSISADSIVGTWKEVNEVATGSFVGTAPGVAYQNGAEYSITKTGAVYDFAGAGTLTPTQPLNYSGTWGPAINQGLQSVIQTQYQDPYISDVVLTLPWGATLSSDGTVMNLVENLTWTWVVTDPGPPTSVFNQGGTEQITVTFDKVSN
ncbi:PE family protein [Mycobacterium sp. Marseille-P9652]|uniref:PE family protein n=1 Tax=Mycobacterium sp. Marseille-P9652 TaxID=2654950 RepID=UPI0012E92C6E|nr:PE family protein [Mycobacterium sp. Marseille-P9652]